MSVQSMLWMYSPDVSCFIWESIDVFACAISCVDLIFRSVVSGNKIMLILKQQTDLFGLISIDPTQT